MVEATISGSLGRSSIKFKASGNSSTLSARDNHALQCSMDNPAAGQSLPIQMAQMEFRKKYNMIAFDQPFTIFEQTRAMSVNTPDDARKECFMYNFENEHLRFRYEHIQGASS